MVDSTGKLTTAWYQFFVSLWTRTGGAAPIGNVQSVNVIGQDGIIAATQDQTTTPVTNLSLGAITPQSIITPGEIVSGPLFATNGTFTGQMRFGSFTGATPVVDGYITILDAAGNSRRLMVGT